MLRKTFAICLVFSVLISGNLIAQQTELTGAGATFPYPLYSKLFDVYHKSFGVRVNYQSISSGGGVRQILNKTVDFGASDGFMSDEDLAKAKGTIVHIPIVLGAVAITYNLPQSPELNLTPDIISGIYLGKIKKWNDAMILSANPGKNLPSINIVVVRRSDGSGTTSIFTDYLAKISTEWKSKVGKGKSVNWPTGLGAKGNEGVAGLIKQIPGSIGYIELAYTIQNKMPSALIQNLSGNFIKPSISSTSLSANGEIPPDTRISLTNTDAPDGYPISGFTWLLVYKEQGYDSRSSSKVNELVKLIWWMTHEGQKYAEPLHYAPLGAAAVEKAEAIIKGITFNGSPVYSGK